jgi:hypothetical protein
MIGLRTNAARGAPPLMPERVAWRRERDAEEARWEAQLGRMATRRPKEVERIVSPPAPVRTALYVVGGMLRHDSLLLPRILPIATGSDAEDLVCGKCGAVIAARLSRAAARCRHPEGRRLVVRCTCKALNLLSGRTGKREPRARRRAGA